MSKASDPSREDYGRKSIAAAIFEALPQAAVVVDLDGRIVLVNGLAEKMFQYKEVELRGQSVDLLVPEELRALHAVHRARFGAHPMIRPMGIGLDLVGRRKDGSEFPVEVSLGPFQIRAKQFVLATISDITVRKQKDEELRETEGLLRALVDSVADHAIFMLDATGHVTTWSLGAERVCGYRDAEIIGKQVSCFFSPED